MEACVAQKSTSRSFNRERWFVLKIPRGDTNGVGEDEVTATSGLHADDDDEDDVYRYYIGE